MIDSATSAKTCRLCGFTETDLARTLRLGCPHCYETFGANLETMLPRLHRGTTHLGKRPDRRLTATRALRRELEEIETLLRASRPRSAQTDELLDRWVDIQRRLQTDASVLTANPPASP